MTGMNSIPRALATAAASAGQGLLLSLGLAGVIGELPKAPMFWLTAVAVALFLVTAGLPSSWRSIAQSERQLPQARFWSEIEAFLTQLAYVHAPLLAWALILCAPTDWVSRIACVVSGSLALATLFSSAWSYALPIEGGAHPRRLAMVGIFILGVAGGSIIFDAILAPVAAPPSWRTFLSFLLLAIACLIQIESWSSLEATRSISASRREQNRKCVSACGGETIMTAAFAVSMTCLLGALFSQDSQSRACASSLAAISVGIGIVVERWIFLTKFRGRAR